jgi:hypothetical protein
MEIPTIGVDVFSGLCLQQAMRLGRVRKTGIDRSVPRKPRPLGRGQGAQYQRTTLPESAAL